MAFECVFMFLIKCCIFLLRLFIIVCNNFRWVREFLNEENKGLDVLIDYLSFRLTMMRHEQRIEESRAMANDGNSQSTFFCQIFKIIFTNNFFSILIFFSKQHTRFREQYWKNNASFHNDY